LGSGRGGCVSGPGPGFGLGGETGGNAGGVSAGGRGCSIKSALNKSALADSALLGSALLRETRLPATLGLENKSAAWRESMALRIPAKMRRPSLQ
jgi:hypothetical protein